MVVNQNQKKKKKAEKIKESVAKPIKDEGKKSKGKDDEEKKKE